MISKKLLDVVYPTVETQECYVDIQESTGRVMWFGKKYKDCRAEIDIYRVANECKKWALNHDCELLSCVKSTRSICDIYSNLLDCKFTHYADSEPEAIFKACEWILTKLKEKDAHNYK